MDAKYTDIAVEFTKKIMAWDSPTGYAEEAAARVGGEFASLGFAVSGSNKGGVLVDLGGRDAEDGVLFQAHVDTLGCMVREIKSNGRLKLSPLGGIAASVLEEENMRLHTRDGRVYEGTYHMNNPSLHVNHDLRDAKRDFDVMELVLDEDVRSAADTRALGIENGDVVAFEPRFRVTESGYIKSRFLDDKLAVGIMYALARFIKDSGRTPERRTYVLITTYEEVGFGGQAPIPEGITESIGVDMGCVGEGISGTERKVSICAKDTSGPYSYLLTSKLIDAAKRAGADYAVDVYPHYGSDVEQTVRAGYDIRHGLLGPGVYASHGYERSHIDGAKNTLLLIAEFLGING